MACQYLLMPLIGYSIVSVMSDMHPALKFGIFASAAAPGGGFSNTWIFVLNGDLDLSIAMTFLSSCAALGFMPLWLYTIGKDILGDTEIVIPFKDLAQSLALLIAPLIIGVVIKRFLPKVTEKLLLAQKPLIAFLLLFALVTGIWANLYAFRMVLTDYRLALCAFLQQVAGGVLGFLIALACQQGKTLAITIGVETAIQNLKIVTIMLRTSLPQPWADISSAVPISMIVFAFPTFIILLIGRLIYTRFIKKEGDDDSEQSHKASISSLELEEGVSNPAVVDNDEKEPEKEKEEKSV
ncbi:P3 protein-like [Watersipora subatra]|uniref:P3 protein-like n=1 Tax=Watersipora subatra TaxID=2589382 RepID=UPI00355AD129